MSDPGSSISQNENSEIDDATQQFEGGCFDRNKNEQVLDEETLRLYKLTFDGINYYREKDI